jgi:hypothetical protein
VSAGSWEPGQQCGEGEPAEVDTDVLVVVGGQAVPVFEVYDHGMGLCDPPAEEDEGELPFEWNQDVARKLEHLRIYASPEVLAAADEAYEPAGGGGTRPGTATTTRRSTTGRTRSTRRS